MSQTVTDVLLPLALGFIMFTLGLGLTPADFGRVLRRPRAVAIGLAGQMLLVPLLAFVLARHGGLSPEMAVGLMLVAACPGGVSSGLLTHLAKGETALSITLTAVTSIAAVASVPFIVDQSMQHFLNVGADAPFPLLKMARGVFLLTTVPVALGMAVKAWRPQWTERMEPRASRLSTALFVLIVIATFASQQDVLLRNLAGVGPAALALNLLAVAGGFGLARLAGLTLRDRIAIATECGLHNVGLGIFVAVGVLHSPALSIPGVVYALLMNVTAIAFVFLMRGRNASPRAEAAGP